MVDNLIAVQVTRNWRTGIGRIGIGRFIIAAAAAVAVVERETASIASVVIFFYFSSTEQSAAKKTESRGILNGLYGFKL